MVVHPACSRGRGNPRRAVVTLPGRFSPLVSLPPVASPAPSPRHLRMRSDHGLPPCETGDSTPRRVSGASASRSSPGGTRLAQEKADIVDEGPRGRRLRPGAGRGSHETNRRTIRSHGTLHDLQPRGVLLLPGPHGGTDLALRGVRRLGPGRSWRCRRRRARRGRASRTTRAIRSSGPASGPVLQLRQPADLPPPGGRAGCLVL